MNAANNEKGSNSDQEPDDAPQADLDDFGRLVVGISHSLNRQNIGSGSLAELRRMKPSTGRMPPAFWRILLTREIGDRWIANQARERSWALLINAMARIGETPHRTGVRPAAALANTNYSETRFVRLIRAEDEWFENELRVACDWLGNAGARIDCVRLARFIFARTDGFRNDEAIERTAQAFARDYVAAGIRNARHADQETIDG